MKNALLIIGMVLICGTLWAKDFTVHATLSWDGKDASGAIEKSLPVTFEVRDAVTDDVVTSAQVNGAVTDYVMPNFVVAAPDNATITKTYYAIARDGAGNVSQPSDIVSVTLKGDDTLPPLSPVIQLIMQ